VNDTAIYMDLLDIAGDEEYLALRDQYYRTGNAFLLVYSIIDRMSFENVQRHYEQILRVKKSDTAGNIPMILLGNKVDLEDSCRAIEVEEAQNYARDCQIQLCMECSAKSGQNVGQIFTELAKLSLTMVADTNTYIHFKPAPTSGKCVLF
jgi:small GTP-binding protein